jgi:regulator of protease activity HflC (stomatin/prohibitin superfamily)
MPLSLQLVLFWIVVIVILAKAIVYVPRGKVYVIAYLGRPVGALNSGWHLTPAFVARVIGKVPVDEQTLDVPETASHLRDGTAVAVRGSIRYRVTNALVAVTAVADYQRALAEVAQTHWRRALESTDVTGFEAALRIALPAIQSAAATWGIEAIDATTLMTMSDDGMRQLQQLAAAERDQRVLAWIRERGESPGPDGHPTAAQRTAYETWMAQAVADHRDEIEAAARAEKLPKFRG